MLKSAGPFLGVTSGHAGRESLGKGLPSVAMSAVVNFWTSRREMLVLNAKAGMDTKTISMLTCAGLQSVPSSKCAWDSQPAGCPDCMPCYTTLGNSAAAGLQRRCTPQGLGTRAHCPQAESKLPQMLFECPHIMHTHGASNYKLLLCERCQGSNVLCTLFCWMLQPQISPEIAQVDQLAANI